jgi:hypothetical protein
MRYKLKNSTLVGYFVNMLTDEYAKLKNEFKDIFEVAPVEPRLSMQPNSVTHLWNRRIISAFGGEDEITFKKLLNEFQRYNNDDVDVSMWANYKTDLENGIVKTTDLSIDINFEVLRADIVYNLEMLELVEENYRLSLRHEVGHIMDYILNFNGRPADEVRDIIKKYKDDKEKYYQKFYEKDMSGRKKEYSEEERMRYYYTEIEGERTANELSNANVDRMIEIEGLLAYHGNDFEVDFEVITYLAKELETPRL